MTELLPIAPSPAPVDREPLPSAPSDDRFARLVDAQRDPSPSPPPPDAPSSDATQRAADDRVRRVHARALSRRSSDDSLPDDPASSPTASPTGPSAEQAAASAVAPTTTPSPTPTPAAALPDGPGPTDGVPAPGSLLMLPGGPSTGAGWTTTSPDGVGTGADPTPATVVSAPVLPSVVAAQVPVTVAATPAPGAPAPGAETAAATAVAGAAVAATPPPSTGAADARAEANPSTVTQPLGAMLDPAALASLVAPSTTGSSAGDDSSGDAKRDGDDGRRSHPAAVDARTAAAPSGAPSHLPDLASPVSRAAMPQVPSGAAAVARAMDLATRAAHGPTMTNRLALELDDATRVAVRMTGRSVRVDVLADPNQRIGSSWNQDLQQGFRRRGLELDQRGADAQGRGRRRDRDEAEGRHARDGARAPRRITLPAPNATPTTTASPT